MHHGYSPAPRTNTSTDPRPHPGVARLRTLLAPPRLLACLPGRLALSPQPVQPWVKPYEREHLADPIMAFDRNPISSIYLDHVFESREGARGASGSVGGGCGCN